MRDRQGFVKSDGWKVPQFWEITRSEKGGNGERGEPVGPAGPTTSGVGGVSGVEDGVIPPGGIAGSTTKPEVKGEEEWVEKADGREADRITQMVDIGQRATLPAPSATAATTTATSSAVVESQPAPPEQTYGARDLLEMPPLDQIVSTRLKRSMTQRCRSAGGCAIVGSSAHSLCTPTGSRKRGGGGTKLKRRRTLANPRRPSPSSQPPRRSSSPPSR